MNIRIQKLLIECDIANHSDPVGFSGNAEHFVKQTVLPLLESLLAELDGEFLDIALPKATLEIDLSELPEAAISFEQVSTETLRSILRQQILKKILNESGSHTVAASIWEQFLFIATKGYPPWNFYRSSHLDFEQQLIQQADSLMENERLRCAVLDALIVPRYAFRVATGFSRDFILELVHSFVGESSIIMNNLLADLDVVVGKEVEGGEVYRKYLLLSLLNGQPDGSNNIVTEFPEIIPPVFRRNAVDPVLLSRLKSPQVIALMAQVNVNFPLQKGETNNGGEDTKTKRDTVKIYMNPDVQKDSYLLSPVSKANESGNKRTFDAMKSVKDEGEVGSRENLSSDNAISKTAELISEQDATRYCIEPGAEDITANDVEKEIVACNTKEFGNKKTDDKFTMKMGNEELSLKDAGKNTEVILSDKAEGEQKEFDALQKHSYEFDKTTIQNQAEGQEDENVAVGQIEEVNRLREFEKDTLSEGLREGESSVSKDIKNRGTEDRRLVGGLMSYKGGGVDYSEEWKEGGIYISNAGIVLLAPYLTNFFEEVSVISENLLQDKPRAVYLLQLLAGSEQREEYRLTLNKILCGLEPMDNIGPVTNFFGKDISEVEQLLKTVIAHWSALKSTSTATLQSCFLQRHGKLHMKDEMIYLDVERKTEDILLDFVPWSFRLIKMPWMKYALSVNWG